MAPVKKSSRERHSTWTQRGKVLAVCNLTRNGRPEALSIYNFPEIVETCKELGFDVEETTHRLVVVLLPERRLVFHNDLEQEDCSSGFEGFPWHFHADLMVMDSSDTYATYNPSELLLALKLVLWLEKICLLAVAKRWLMEGRFDGEYPDIFNREEALQKPSYRRRQGADLF